MTGMAGGINMGNGDGTNGANKAGGSTWGTGMQAKGKGRGKQLAGGIQQGLGMGDGHGQQEHVCYNHGTDSYIMHT